MNSKTAGYFGIGITPMSGSEPAAVESPAVQQIDESEEENSYDKNDDMSEEDEFVGGSHIEISDDGGGNAGGRPR